MNADVKNGMVMLSRPLNPRRQKQEKVKKLNNNKLKEVSRVPEISKGNGNENNGTGDCPAYTADAGRNSYAQKLSKDSESEKTVFFQTSQSSQAVKTSAQRLSKMSIMSVASVVSVVSGEERARAR